MRKLRLAPSKNRQEETGEDESGSLKREAAGLYRPAVLPGFLCNGSYT
jgi:hypothetical protein